MRVLTDVEQRPIPLPGGEGAHINTLIAGHKDLPALVLLHGYGAGVGFWYSVLPGLSQRFHV